MLTSQLEEHGQLPTAPSPAATPSPLLTLLPAQFLSRVTRICWYLCKGTSAGVKVRFAERHSEHPIFQEKNPEVGTRETGQWLRHLSCMWPNPIQSPVLHWPQVLGPPHTARFWPNAHSSSNTEAGKGKALILPPSNLALSSISTALPLLLIGQCFRARAALGRKGLVWEQWMLETQSANTS